MKGLKLVYQAINKDVAGQALNKFEFQWDEDYPIIISN